MTATYQRLMSVEEYLEFEKTAEMRHEYINGQLLEMPGEKRINNQLSFFLGAFFLTLSQKGYHVYGHDVKVAIPEEDKFYYPDFLLTAEPETDSNAYVVYHPELIAEILSKTSRTRDTVDKYLDYIKIPSLKYYLIIDPETPYITVHAKRENEEWESDAYSSRGAIIALPLLGSSTPNKGRAITAQEEL